MGAFYSEDGQTLHFRIFSAHATRFQVELFAKAHHAESVKTVLLKPDLATGIWSADVPLSELHGIEFPEAIYYGLRAWGPNWQYDPAWQPGSFAGLVAHKDLDGNHFDPNKLLIDPYAQELSHDLLDYADDERPYWSGPEFGAVDTAPILPKGIILPDSVFEENDEPEETLRPRKEHVIAEVHLRGLTMRDRSVPAELRGTFAGATLKVPYFERMGYTAAEFLPLAAFPGGKNGVRPTTANSNYWGYMVINNFAPNPRYSSDKRPGGPTREFRKMVRAFRKKGIEVVADLVLNHTGEGRIIDGNPDVAPVFSYRGIDNQNYYQVAKDRRFYVDFTGCGHNINSKHPMVIRLFQDTVRKWRFKGGARIFRFDVIPILANSHEGAGFRYDKEDASNGPNILVRDFGDSSILIGEPIAAGEENGEGIDLSGQLPRGMAEWNVRYKSVIRAHQNRFGIVDITPGQLAQAIAGSEHLFGGRGPDESINLVASHDGPTLWDSLSGNQANNSQEWPFGPSDVVDPNPIMWDHGGSPEAQRQAARTSMALLMMSLGVPMVQLGDGSLQTQRWNTNPWNVDSEGTWHDWDLERENKAFVEYMRRLIKFRRAHPALQRDQHFTGNPQNESDIPDVTWHMPNGEIATPEYMNDPKNGFLGYRIDGATVAGESVKSIFVGYNGLPSDIEIILPPPRPDTGWHRVADTAAWFEKRSNFHMPGKEVLLTRHHYGMKCRSLLIAIER